MPPQKIERNKDWNSAITVYKKRTVYVDSIIILQYKKCAQLITLFFSNWLLIYWPSAALLASAGGPSEIHLTKVILRDLSMNYAWDRKFLENTLSFMFLLPMNKIQMQYSSSLFNNLAMNQAKVDI